MSKHTKVGNSDLSGCQLAGAVLSTEVVEKETEATKRGPDFDTHPLPPSFPSKPVDIPFLAAAPLQSTASPERRGVCAAGCDLLLSPVRAAGLCTFLGNDSDPPRQCLIRA